MDSKFRRRVVVLGANGFLGSSMVRHLAASGHQVTAWMRHQGPDFSDLKNVQVQTGDIRDTWSLEAAIRDVDVVYHFASSTYPSLFFANPSAEFNEALQPLIWLMEVAARSGVQKIVFPSSGGTVYAADPNPRVEHSATDPRSPYAILKLAAEQLLLHAARQNQFAVDIYRIGNPYGPGQRVRSGQGVIPHWIQALGSGQPIRVFGDGSASRDYIYIDDACRLMASSCQQLDASDLLNLGTGRATSLNQLLEIMLRLIGRDHPVQQVSSRDSDVQSIALVPDRLLERVGEFSFTTIEEGLRTTLAQAGLCEVAGASKS